MELPSRLSHWSRDQFGSVHRWCRADKLNLKNIWSAPSDPAYFHQRPNRFFYDLNKLSTSDWPGAWRKNCLAHADDLLQHKFTFFAFDNEPLGESIDWNRDYSSDKSIPLTYAHRLNYRRETSVGDVKYVWELNRHQHLVRLAQAYWITGDDKYAHEITTQITSWIEQCPYMHGVNWTSPMESALRLISWTWAFELIRSWPGLDESFTSLLISSVYQHLRFIDRHYSRHSSANNHLIAEASGAYMTATYWSEIKNAPNFRRRAYQHLIRQCLIQNAPDGVNREQAFGYQFFVFDLLLLPALIGKANHEPFPVAYWDRLEKMAYFIASISDCNCNTPNVGDADDGCAIKLSGRREHRTQSLLNTAAMVFNRRDFKSCTTSRLDEKTTWLFGPNAKHIYDQLNQTSPAPAPRANRPFCWGGYYVLRKGSTPADEALLLFDCGPLGWPATAAHAHADALSINLSIAGVMIMIDPGTFSYRDNPWRAYFRSTAQHNTLTFGNDNQAQYLNRFLWGKKPKTTLTQFATLDNITNLEGRVVWPDGSWHRRAISWHGRQNYFELEDQWHGKAKPTINFSLAPTVQVNCHDNTAFITAKSAHLQLICTDHPVTIEQMYVSPRFYQKTTTQRISIQPTQNIGKAIIRINWSINATTPAISEQTNKRETISSTPVKLQYIRF